MAQFVLFTVGIVFGLLKLHKFRLAVHVSGETFKADFFHCRRNFVVIVSDAVGAVCVAAERNFPSAEFVVSFQDVDVGGLKGVAKKTRLWFFRRDKFCC